MSDWPVIEAEVEMVARAICEAGGLVKADEALDTIRTQIVRGRMAPAWRMYEQQARSAIAALKGPNK